MGKRAKAPSRDRRVRTADTTTLPLFASAMQHIQPGDDLRRVQERPTHISTGLPSVDKALRGGFPVGAASLVAARLRVGATSMLIGAALAALERGERVSYFSERLRQEQIRGRFVVLESRVNGHRFRAGFATAEDRIALAAARERIPWNLLSISTRRRLSHAQIDANIFSYRPWLVIADLQPRPPRPPHSGPVADRQAALLEGIERLASIARKHRVALVVRMLLPRGSHPPDPLELPGLGAALEPFTAAVLLHREPQGDDDGEQSDGPSHAEARVVRVAGATVEPRVVPLRFDQRFAGLLEV